MPKLSGRVRASALALGGDLSLAALIGGNLFGRYAMGPALVQISDRRERGKVLNRAWRRYGAVNSLASAGLVATWIPARRALLARRLAARERALVAARDLATAGVLASGLATALGGVRFAHEAPEGAVPMQDGVHAAPEAPRGAARTKTLVNALGGLNLGFELALAAINAALAQRQSH
jgi:hypothetical protein